MVASFFRVSTEPRGHVRGRAVDGRLRRAQAGPHPPRAVRRGRLAVRRARPALPGRREPTAPSFRTGSSTAPSATGDDLFALLAAAPRRSRRSTSAAAPRTRCSTATPSASSTRPPPPGVDVTTRPPAGRARVVALGRDDPGRHRLAARCRVSRVAVRTITSAHDACADRRRRAERLLRGRLAAGRRGRPGGRRHRRAAPPLDPPGRPRAGVRPRGGHQGPPRRPRATTGRASPTSSTPGRCTAGSAPTARRSTPTSTRSPSTRSSSRASTRRRTPASRAVRRTARRSPTGCARAGSSRSTSAGIATDYCVRATALDARTRGVRDPRADRAVCRRRARDHRDRPRGDAAAGVTLG